MTGWGWALSAFVGVLVGGVELASRFRAFPAAALLSVPGVCYLLLNGLTSAFAYGLAVAFDWRFGLDAAASESDVALLRVLVCGLGAMALLRSSVLTVAQGSTSVDAGPAALLTALRRLVDRAVEQHHGSRLLERSLLEGLRFDKHHEALTLLCSVTQVDPPPESAQQLGDLAAQLDAMPAVEDAVKMRTYAARLLEAFGAQAVAQARRALLDASTTGPATTPSVAARAVPAQPDERTGYARRRWREAVALQDLLELYRAHDDEEQIQHVAIRLAASLSEVDVALGAWAWSSVPVADAPDVLGAETVLGGGHTAASRLLPLLVAEKRVAPVGRGKGYTYHRPPWLVAAALTELARHLDDDLALDVLDVSVEIADHWDVRLLRAAVRLERDREAALTDLDAVLREEDRPTTILGAALVPADVTPWVRVVEPLTALLRDSQDSRTRRLLWQTAVREWQQPSGLRRPSSPVQLTPSTSLRGVDSVVGRELPRLLTAAARSVPPRRATARLGPGDLRLAEPPRSVPTLPESLRQRLRDAVAALPEGTAPEPVDVAEALRRHQAPADDNEVPLDI